MTTPLTVKFKLQQGGILPLKAHQDDAGFDLFVPADVKLTDDPVVIDTKVLYISWHADLKCHTTLLNMKQYTQVKVLHS